MPVRLIVAPTAQAEIREALAWWRTHRTKAPHALAADLKSAFRLLREHPAAGTRVDTDPSAVWRLPLGRVRYLLYYRYAENSVEILSLWHASRGRRPRL